MTHASLQERFAPLSRCFGCGPANPRGLHVRSYVEAGDVLLCTFVPEPHHEAFPGMVNGGILGAVLDCHSNWAAAHSLMRARGANTPPCTVTADFHVKLRKPTPLDQPLMVRAAPVRIDGDRVVIEATLGPAGWVTATCTGTFVAVKEGHPAFHQW